jgi:hypothetical protein
MSNRFMSTLVAGALAGPFHRSAGFAQAPTTQQA